MDADPKPHFFRAVYIHSAGRSLNLPGVNFEGLLPELSVNKFKQLLSSTKFQNSFRKRIHQTLFGVK